MKNLLIIIFLTPLFSCHDFDKKDTVENKLTIDVLPFNDISKETVNRVFIELKKIYPNIELKQPMALPKSAYYLPRNRYRADSLIRFIKNITPKDHVTIALTSKDISATKGKISDYGIMGLGYRPGNACVVSTYRLSNENKFTELFKYCLHELGHTSGLPHCPEKTCFMRDAEGGNPTNEETDFCTKCKSHLISKGWLFEK